jgi:(R,R)-butanediol dehydrogenase / meso-butanediol dehydrogenase / diacetyl reductase
MKALRWYGRRDLRFEDVPEPHPGRGQVKVKIKLAGICGTDLKEYISGPGMIPPENVPIIPGHEYSGQIIELGEGASGFKTGDRVTGLGYWKCGDCYFCRKGQYNLCANWGFTGLSVNGCMAEYLVVPDYSVYKLPDNVTYEIGALTEPLSVAVHAVRQGQVRPGDRVAVLGDGTIGLSVLMAARLAGASATYMVSKHEGRGQVAREMGATAVIGTGAGTAADRIRELTGGLGADIAFECVGQPSTPQESMLLVRKGGTVVILGVFDKTSVLDFGKVSFNEINIIGSSIYIREAETVLAYLADGRMDPSPLISAIVPLKDAASQGFERLISDKENNIKVLLEVTA